MGAAWAADRDDGEMALEDVLDHLRLLVSATSLPVNADFENGFADQPADVARNVALAAATGVAAVSIEDWSGDLRCSAGGGTPASGACGARRD